MIEAYDIYKYDYTPPVACYTIWYNQLGCLTREIPDSKFVLVQLPDFCTHSLNVMFCEFFPPLESKVEGFKTNKSAFTTLESRV